MGKPAESSDDTGLPWYRGIAPYAWVVLAISALGWLFDTMDQHLFNLVRQPSVRDLLTPHIAAARLDGAIQAWSGILTAVFLIGWAVGGFIFGIVGDRIGRTRTMIYTICIYAVFTGLNAFVPNVWLYALCRFLTALGVGGEFAAGTALVAEVWPNRSRAMALGTLQASSAFGNIIASFVTLGLSQYSWRYAYLVGILPALLVIWIRRSVREPDRWVRVRDAALLDPATNRELGNIWEVFGDPTLRRNTITGMMLALAGVGGVWGAAFFLPDLVGAALKPYASQLPHVVALAGADKAKEIGAVLTHYRSTVSLVQQVGALFGMFSYPIVSQWIGRRRAFAMFFILAFLAVEATFWLLHDPLSAYALALPMGFCALAPFSGFAVYFPELYPTRVRATGIGLCYNGARILAAFAPLALGGLARHFGDPADGALGYRRAAAIVACIYGVGLLGLIWAPETKGKPLPE